MLTEEVLHKLSTPRLLAYLKSRRWNASGKTTTAQAEQYEANLLVVRKILATREHISRKAKP